VDRVPHCGQARPSPPAPTRSISTISAPQFVDHHGAEPASYGDADRDDLDAVEGAGGVHARLLTGWTACLNFPRWAGVPYTTTTLHDANGLRAVDDLTATSRTAQTRAGPARYGGPLHRGAQSVPCTQDSNKA
jgi:hypothetical protein